jgi:hypothetical protein
VANNRRKVMKGKGCGCGGGAKTDPKMFGTMKKESSNMVKGKSAKVPDGKKAKH